MATAEAMRAVHEQRRQGKLTLNENGIETAKRLSWESAARKICSVLGVANAL
jgi:hypothetical protein